MNAYGYGIATITSDGVVLDTESQEPDEERLIIDLETNEAHMILCKKEISENTETVVDIHDSSIEIISPVDTSVLQQFAGIVVAENEGKLKERLTLDEIIIDKDVKMPSELVIDIMNSDTYNKACKILSMVNSTGYDYPFLQSIPYNQFAIENGKKALIYCKEKHGYFKDGQLSQHYRAFRGYVYGLEFDALSYADQQRRVPIEDEVPEYSPKQTVMQLHHHACRYCHVGHATLADTECRKLGGLRAIPVENLVRSDEWKETCQIIIIASAKLKELPTELKGRVVCIELNEEIEYCTEKLKGPLRDKQCTLYTHLMRILKAIGIKQTLPVFVEFTPSRSNRRHGNSHGQHIAFVRICKLVQDMYGGLIIPTMGLTSPHYGMTNEDYMKQKTAAKIQSICARTVGRFMGITVDYMLIQSQCDEQQGNRALLPIWSPEPLYNRYAQPTKEWFRRVRNHFESRMVVLQGVYPLRSGLMLQYMPRAPIQFHA